MKRVVIFSTGLGRGGAETQLMRVARELVARGVRVTVVSLLDNNLWEEDLAESGIAYRCLHFTRGRPSAAGFARALALLVRERPCVVLSFLTAANVLARVAAPLAGVPAVVSSVRSIVSGSSRKSKYEFFLANRDHAVVFNARCIADDAIARGLLEPARARVLRNALDLDAFDARVTEAARAGLREEAGVGDDDFVWISVGNVRPVKNMSSLVRAFRRVHKDWSNARLWVVGRHYEDYPAALEAAGDLVDAGVVRFWGLRQDIPELLSAADAFALASHREGTPNAVIEAHAAKLPVAATRVGGTPEVLEDGVSGWMIDAPTDDAIELTLREAMATEQRKRASMGVAGRARVEREHAAPALLDAWFELLSAAARGDVVASNAGP